MVYFIKAQNSTPITSYIKPEPPFAEFAADAQKKYAPTPQKITPTLFHKTHCKASNITEIAKAAAEAYKTAPDVKVADLQKQIKADLKLYAAQKSYTNMAGYYKHMRLPKNKAEIKAIQAAQLNKIAEMSAIAHTGYTAPIMGIRACEVSVSNKGYDQINTELADTSYDTFAKCPDEQYGLFKTTFERMIKGQFALAVDNQITPKIKDTVASSERAAESYFNIPTIHVYTSQESNTLIDKGPEDSSEMSIYFHELLHADRYLNHVDVFEDGLPILKEEYFAYYHDQKFLYGNRSTTQKDLRRLAVFIKIIIDTQSSINKVITPTTKEYAIVQQVIKDLRAGKDITPDEFNKLFV